MSMEDIHYMVALFITILGIIFIIFGIVIGALWNQIVGLAFVIVGAGLILIPLTRRYKAPPYEPPKI